MVVIGVVGVLAPSLVLMELVCGKILEGGGILYLGLSCMKLEMVKSVVLARSLVWIFSSRRPLS